MNVHETLPALPEGLTADWLTSALHAAGLGRGTRIEQVGFGAVGEGVGMMSELARLTLRWSNETDAGPTTLIAKYASTNPTNRAAGDGFHVYEREVRFFSELNQLTTARTPVCHFARYQSGNYLVLMEDLGAYRTGSQAEGAGLEDALLAVDELARLHAPFWGRVEALDWVPTIYRSYHADALYTMAVGSWDKMVNTYADHVPDSIRAAGPAIHAALPALQAAVNQGPATLIHGDFRLDNVMFGSAPEHDPIIILDWQGPLRARGIVDIAVLLAQNVHVSVRRQHEQALIQRYTRRLAEFGVSYGEDEAWRDYRVALMYLWCYCTTITGGLDGSDPRAYAWMSQCVARQCTATLDHDLLPEFSRWH